MSGNKLETTTENAKNQRNNLPKIRVKWIRGSETINLTAPKTWVNLGQKGSGKSSLNEALAVNYPKIIDLFGSRDNEGLAWCRSPLKDSILFICGDSVKISTQYPVKKISELTLKDFNDYDVALTVHSFFNNLREEFIGLNKILDILYQCTHWNEPWALVIREAANFIYSRITLGKNQFEAKAEFIYLLREGRHMGYPVGVDTIRWTSIDIEIRDVSDYIFIKSIGRKGLPPELRFVYRYINPFSLMRMAPDKFLIITDTGAIGVGSFDFPYWHKKEKEDLLRQFNIEIEYGEVPNYGNPRRNTVSDFEHDNLMTIYEREKSCAKVAKLTGRSAQTINTHYRMHTQEGGCPICRRIKN